MSEGPWGAGRRERGRMQPWGSDSTRLTQALAPRLGDLWQDSRPWRPANTAWRWGLRNISWAPGVRAGVGRVLSLRQLPLTLEAGAVALSLGV